MTSLDPDYTDDLDTDDDLDDDGNLPGKLRKQLREANKRAKAAEERAEANAAAARRVAFLDAGIPDTPQTKFFREHYSGELTGEAIKASALDNGFLTAEDHSSEIDALDQASQDMGGGFPPDAMLGDAAEMQQAMDEAVASAPRGQESRAIAAVVDRYRRQA